MGSARSISVGQIVIFWAFIYGVGQKYFSWPIITTQNLEYSKGIALRYMPGGHLVSTFAGHYDMATFLILVLPVILSTMFLNLKGFVEFNTKAKSMLFKGILAVTFLAGFWLLVNTASRISIVSYFISTILVLVLIRKLKYIPVLLAISILFVSLSTNLLARYSQIFNVYIQKIVLVQPLFAIDEESATTRRARTVEPTPAAIEVLEDRSTSIRLNIEWPRAIRAFQKNPFLGTGFSSITLATDNDYLRLLGEVGILGFLSFALILLRLVTFYVRKFLTFKGLTLRRGFILGIAAGLPGVLLNAVFIDVFEASKFAIMFWLLVGFSFSRVFGKNTNI
jgi:O-antigen ligase